MSHAHAALMNPEGDTLPTVTPPESINIRDCAPAEYDDAGELVVEAYRTLGDSGDEFYEQELRDIAGRAATSDVLVAESDGRILGCVTYVDGLKALSEVDDPDAGTIRMLGVATLARGRGIGEALVRACVYRARASGRARVRLDTRTSMTSAQRLYARLGFRRDPEHDWSPAPGIRLLAYVLDLEAQPSTSATD
jgi:ribosomal protein S18 acetylase RimI-like enzyme